LLAGTAPTWAATLSFDRDSSAYWQAVVAKNVRSRRKASGLTQASLAAAAQINLRTLGEVERAECNTTISVLAQIAGGLGCRLSDLFADPEGETR
jgi:transcriptional regulator with XRE-family HTH domain